MASNALERAVIEAARAYGHDDTTVVTHNALIDALTALERWEATQPPEVMELGWHELAEGDELRSVKNGQFYPVRRTLAILGGKVEITLQGVPKAITRPTEAEPTAWVRRGTTGVAVDTITHVFSSGG